MENKKIKIKIDGHRINCRQGKTIMEVAYANGIDIPGLCYHPDFEVKGNCRICMVELKNKKELVASCHTQVEEGMEILTNSKKVKNARNLNIELLFSEHIQKCGQCVWRINCKLLDLAKKYDIDVARFNDRKKERRTYKFANAVELDGSQCIDCRNCVHACQVLQNINYLQVAGKSYKQEIKPVQDKKIDCIYCGQCTVHCPVGAAREQTQWKEVEKKLKRKDRVVVAQFAPSIRVSIGEEFGMGHGRIVTDQVVGALKRLGFDHVFDVNFGADVTTMVEAKELLDRLEGGENMPIITSCCPAWVKYVEFYHPELIPNLTASRSPHIHLAGLIKTYWAKKMDINPAKIDVVSVMPCTAKKFEAIRPELKIQGKYPVNNVITTREFAWLLKKNRIEFQNVKKAKADHPLGEYSEAAPIYGGSGGVMESALRTAAHLAKPNAKKKNNKKIVFEQTRGNSAIKEAKVDVAGKKLRIGMVNGIGNAPEMIKNLADYDYVEVMACPGGCIGGGGQPIPTNNEVRKKRVEVLHKLDKNKQARKAHENEGVKEVMKWLEQNEKLKNKVLYTKYKTNMKLWNR
jgi:NADH-quinone oxidoreductase subunit G/NADP-reducing hydrogenase subunit HndD